MDDDHLKVYLPQTKTVTSAVKKSGRLDTRCCCWSSINYYYIV